jgi:hypothetical protein
MHLPSTCDTSTVIHAAAAKVSNKPYDKFDHKAMTPLKKHVMMMMMMIA